MRESDDIVSAVIDADDKWDLENAVVLDEVEEEVVKRHLHQLQECCRAKNQSVSSSTLE